MQQTYENFLAGEAENRYAETEYTVDVIRVTYQNGVDEHHDFENYDEMYKHLSQLFDTCSDAYVTVSLYNEWDDCESDDVRLFDLWIADNSSNVYSSFSRDGTNQMRAEVQSAIDNNTTCTYMGEL